MPDARRLQEAEARVYDPRGSYTQYTRDSEDDCRWGCGHAARRSLPAVASVRKNEDFAGTGTRAIACGPWAVVFLSVLLMTQHGGMPAQWQGDGAGIEALPRNWVECVNFQTFAPVGPHCTSPPVGPVCTALAMARANRARS